MDPERIEQLRAPEIFAHDGGEVEIVQTHLSVVCLFGNYAYKFKKSIRLPFADFSTLEKRKEYCEEELRLNRRLCPTIYLEVVALRKTSAEELRFGDEGEIVDYAVRMLRLPADRMMDLLLERDRVTEEDIREIARVVIGFHDRAERSPDIDRFGSPDALARFAADNFEDSAPFVGEIFSGSLHSAMKQRTARDFGKHLPVLRERVAQRRVVDGHGDLHARNICLAHPVAIYDCIEFEPAFRCGDVATEHAFLLMDLRYRGHPEQAAAYLAEVLRGTGDEGMRAILPTLMRYRAMVRAKVAAIASSEDEIPDVERKAAVRSARHHLALVATLAVEEDGPLWILMCGLPASGKSTLAEALAAVSRWPIHSSDRIRKELAGASPEEKLPEEYYTAKFSDRTYEELMNRAVASVGNQPGEPSFSGKVAILDANFRTRTLREAARSEARKCGARLAIVHVQSSPPELHARLRARVAGFPGISDADESVYENLKDEFEEPGPGEAAILLQVSGEEATGASRDRILSGLLGA